MKPLGWDNVHPTAGDRALERSVSQQWEQFLLTHTLHLRSNFARQLSDPRVGKALWRVSSSRPGVCVLEILKIREMLLVCLLYFFQHSSELPLPTQKSSSSLEFTQSSGRVQVQDTGCKSRLQHMPLWTFHFLNAIKPQASLHPGFPVSLALERSSSLNIAPKRGYSLEFPPGSPLSSQIRHGAAASGTPAP